ncbi:MAG: hypothetical protein EBZ77_09370, partial [Chitinophagia bacterium]|nr:hypothetical protein [Chitinophagia bacterium]
MAKQLLKIIAAILLVLPAACVKDAPDIHQPTAPASRKGVYVVCEGKYTSGDASLYLYQEQGDSIFGDVYQAVNGKKLGDVFQSMSVAGRFFVLCI